MIRKIITPQEHTYVLKLPEDFVGKEIDVLAFELKEDPVKPEKGSAKLLKEKAERLREIRERFSKYRIDLSSYKFDRDEANEYE